MKKLYMIAAVITALALAGCDEQTSNKKTQAEAAKRAAESLVFTDNAEIENIKKRIAITSKPGALGFILLMNEAGQPILYEGVEGKITSGGKRLTAPHEIRHFSTGTLIAPSPSDEGTWGNSGEYIFYWTTSGEYRQWNGKYLYSDKPFRTRIEPLIIRLNPVESKP